MALYEAGSTQVELASSFGLSQARVSQILRMGGKVGRKAQPTFDVDEAKRLYETGMSTTAVGETLGVSQSVIASHLRRAGVTRSQRGRGPAE